MTVVREPPKVDPKRPRIDRAIRFDAIEKTIQILHDPWGYLAAGQLCMPTKVNIVLDDDVKADLDRLVESGKRSRVINNALRRDIQLMSRRAANARLEEIRSTTRRVSSSDMVRLVRRDRGRGRS